MAETTGEALPKVICPRREAGIVQPGVIASYCVREGCAWWDAEQESCCVVTLADELGDIRVLLATIAQHMAGAQAEEAEAKDDSAAE